MIYDIIIIGGSAIGLYLACELSKKGKKVLVLEKNKEIGKKLCSGLVSKNIFKYLPQKEISQFIEKKIKGANLWIEDRSFLFQGSAFVVSRSDFDNYLFKKAFNLGSKILLNKEFSHFKERKDSIRVFLKSGEFFDGKILAGCDGVYSTVAKEAGFPEQRRQLLGIVAYEEKYPLKDDYFVDLFFSKRFKGFFAWRIPHNNKIEWGIALEKKENPREKLEEFLISRGIFPSDFKGTFFPYFPLQKTSKGRVFLCGDAAGQIKPYTGGGLIYGFECARIAAKLINKCGPSELKEYDRSWRKSLMKDIYFGDLLRRCYRLPNLIKKIGLTLLQKRKGIDQDSPSSIF